MPPIGLLLGGVDFSSVLIVLKEGAQAAPYASLAAAKSAGVMTPNLGSFGNTLISFLIVSLAIFVVIKLVNRLCSGEPAPADARSREFE